MTDVKNAIVCPKIIKLIIDTLFVPLHMHIELNNQVLMVKLQVNVLFFYVLIILSIFRMHVNEISKILPVNHMKLLM